MGVYLNSKKPYTVYKKMAQSVYFIDKTALLNELIPVVDQDGGDIKSVFMQTGGKDLRYICITRPRRFGKTVMADMIASFFGKGEDSRSVFEKLAISCNDKFEKHLNQHNVIHIAFNEIPKNCNSYEQYINRIEERLVNDLLRSFPKAAVDKDEAVWDVLNDLYGIKNKQKCNIILNILIK